MNIIRNIFLIVLLGIDIFAIELISIWLSFQFLSNSIYSIGYIFDIFLIILVGMTIFLNKKEKLTLYSLLTIAFISTVLFLLEFIVHLK